MQLDRAMLWTSSTLSGFSSFPNLKPKDAAGMGLWSHRLLFWAIASVLLERSQSQHPPTPEGVTVVNATGYLGASISFKETQICETTAGVKGYSGFVNLPRSPTEGQPDGLHIWFWFFEARKTPQAAPLSLWFQGGPGAPSTPAAVGENGPCLILPNSKDTKLNPWSWNEEVNLLYIDQPVQTGFSYDTLLSGTINEPASPFSVRALPPNATVLSGVFSSQNLALTPNSTMAVAATMWHFMQVWLQYFPGYRSVDKKFSMWGESYGGHYVPTFAEFFYTQNERIASGQLSNETAAPLHVTTVGLVNACIDASTQIPLYPVMATNNTYGIRIYDDSVQANVTAAIPECLNLTKTCQHMSDALDPQGWGNSSTVNQACLQAYVFCFSNVARENSQGGLENGIYHFDIASSELNSFPPKWAAGYFNRAEVQQALGVPLNWTGNSGPISQAFTLAGDFIKGKNLENLGKLLDRGTKVALMYGDRDYQCNWYGGEAISLAIESQIASKFKDSGYADIQTNTSYIGGLVRQYGNLSFSRVYQAGHEVPYYQPETAYQIFRRVMFDRDVATGTRDLTDSTYGTTGKASAVTSDDKPVVFQDRVDCYFWDMLETCTPFQKALFVNGSAIAKDFVMIGYRLADGTQVIYNTTATTTTSPPPSPSAFRSDASKIASRFMSGFTAAILAAFALGIVV